MTTETVCVPRDELLELLQDGVDDYWITTEDGARIVEILRASLAQSVILDWRAYSAQFARGEKCPETLETLPAAWTRDHELIFDQKAQISRIKETVNDLRQKLAAQPVASEPVAWQWLGTAHFRRKIPKYANACHWDPLYRHPPASAIPQGYALVPIEPTEAMRDAGNIYTLNRATLMRIWADMLAAAPQPTEGSTDE